MARPITQLRDDFENNLQDPLWGESGTTGSATKAETGGQCVLTLPASTAGTHSAFYRTSGRYDLTGGALVANIGTMVATAVAASAFVQLIDQDSTGGQLYWQQVSGTLTARKIDGGVNTSLFSVAWNATTYKYLRIREASGTTFFDSSTDGVTWTNRASTTTATPITSMAVQLAVSCGNVASPGSFRISDINLILPALSTTWNWVQCERPEVDYVRTITVCATQGAFGGQAYIATSQDGVTWAYYSGPIGSTSGGYDQLVLAASQAVAQAMAVNLPTSVYPRWDLPSMVQCRFVRLYHRSAAGSSYRIDEFYPRRLVQSDDIEAESIRAINIAAGAITADKIFVLNLAAVSAQMGALHMDGVIDIATTGGIYQGSGTFAAPTTGLKIFNSSGIGKISTYNAGVEQVTFDTDGKLKAGAGNVLLDAGGISLINNTSAEWATAGYKLITSAGLNYGVMNGAAGAFGARATVGVWNPTSQIYAAWVDFLYDSSGTGLPTSNYRIQLNASSGVSISNDLAVGGDADVTAGINVGSATGAGTGQVFASNLIRASGATAPASGAGLELAYINTTTGGLLQSYNRSSSAYTPLLIDASDISLRPSGTAKIRVNSTGIGFFNTTPAAKQTVTGVRTGTLAQLQTVVANMLTALATYGEWTDSTT